MPKSTRKHIRYGGQDCEYDQHDLFAGTHLELDVANVAIYLGNLYQGLLGYDLLCHHNEALGTATITWPGPDKPGVIIWPQKKVGCVAVTQMEPQ